MQVSAELRWFWQDHCPDEVSSWFSGPDWMHAPVREQRSDAYFPQPGNTEIGCKIRGGAQADDRGSEIKALITRFERNHIELWGKWNWLIPADAQRIVVHKDRLVRHCSAFEPATGTASPAPATATENTCRIELTQVRVDGFESKWCTLGLEAWGDLASAPLTLARGLDILNPPTGSARPCNYPQFLDRLLGK